MAIGGNAEVGVDCAVSANGAASRAVVGGSRASMAAASRSSIGGAVDADGAGRSSMAAASRSAVGGSM